MQILKYRHTGNLGDAIQTIALARLLPGPCRHVWRDSCDDADPAERFVLNGWLGKNRAPMANTNTLFAGIHYVTHPANLRWLRASPWPIGVRDPSTWERLSTAGLTCEMIGCATLTLEPQPAEHGRRGVFAVDAWHEGAESLTHGRDGEWEWQLAEGERLLALYRAAEMVVTSRLHVALPCLAFGTPVIITCPCGSEARFSLLAALGVKCDGTPQRADVSALASRYRAFLANV